MQSGSIGRAACSVSGDCCERATNERFDQFYPLLSYRSVRRLHRCGAIIGHAHLPSLSLSLLATRQCGLSCAGLKVSVAVGQIFPLKEQRELSSEERPRDQSLDPCTCRWTIRRYCTWCPPIDTNYRNIARQRDKCDRVGSLVATAYACVGAHTSYFCVQIIRPWASARLTFSCRFVFVFFPRRTRYA